MLQSVSTSQTSWQSLTRAACVHLLIISWKAIVTHVNHRATDPGAQHEITPPWAESGPIQAGAVPPTGHLFLCQLNLRAFPTLPPTERHTLPETGLSPEGGSRGGLPRVEAIEITSKHMCLRLPSREKLGLDLFIWTFYSHSGGIWGPATN